MRRARGRASSEGGNRAARSAQRGDLDQVAVRIAQVERHDRPPRARPRDRAELDRDAPRGKVALPVGERNGGKEAQVGRPWQGARRFRLELRAREVKVDLLRTEAQRMAARAVGGQEALGLHAQPVDVEGAGCIKVGNGEDEMIERIENGHGPSVPGRAHRCKAGARARWDGGRGNASRQGRERRPAGACRGPGRGGILGPMTHRDDRLDPARAEALHAILDRDGPAPGAGDTLPDFWHHAFFWRVPRPAETGPDGHALPGGEIPDMGLPRRMWAGGRLSFHRPLVLGRPARKETELTAQARKTGRSGPLAFVTLRHRYSQEGRVALVEEQDLVYRAAHDPAAPTPAPPPAPAAPAVRSFAVPITTLFRYSAALMNGHRIHYDRAHARAEGYAAPVVHGPLLAQSLLDAATDALGPLAAFVFRATAPLLEDEPAEIRRDGMRLWIAGPGERLCMSAEATPRG